MNAGPCALARVRPEEVAHSRVAGRRVLPAAACGVPVPGTTGSLGDSTGPE